MKRISALIDIAGNLAFLSFLCFFVLPIAFIGKKLIHDDTLMIRYIGQCIFILPLRRIADFLERNEFDEDDPYAFE